MDRNQYDDDPQLDRNSRVERIADDMGSEHGDLGRAQADGNLGNERTRSRTHDDDRPGPDDRNDRNDRTDRGTTDGDI